MKKSANELADELSERIKTDTNTLLTVSHRDRHILKLTAVINSELKNEVVSAEFCEKSYSMYYELLSLLGFEKKKTESDNDAEIEKLVAERTEAKKAKNYARADEIRELLKTMGVVVEDTVQGAKWKRV